MYERKNSDDQAWRERMNRLEIVSIDPRLSKLAMCVAFRIFARTGRENRVAYPSQALLAAELNVTDRSIRNAIKELEDGGHLVTEHYKGRNCSNVYAIVGASDGERRRAAARLIRAQKKRKRVSGEKEAMGFRDTPATGNVLPRYPGN